MSSPKVYLKLIRFTAILSILGGLIFFSWKVTIEYVEYRTSTVISITDYPEDVIPPGVSFCVRFHIDPTIESKIDQLFSNYFNDKNDSWRIKSLVSQMYPGKKLQHTISKYFMGNKYCFFISVKDHFPMEQVEESSSIGLLPNFYQFALTMEPIQSPYAFKVHERQCNPKPVYLLVIPDEKTISKPTSRVTDYNTCSRIVKYYHFDISYQTAVNLRLPSPYDSNCLDYDKKGYFMSQYDCIDKCLKRKTLKFNIVPGTILIKKDKYIRSDMDIIPSMFIEGKMGMDELLKNGTKRKTLPQRLHQSYLEVRSKWKEFKKSCRKHCKRRDCVSEEVMPTVASIEEGPKGSNKTLLGFIKITLRISDHPLVKVTWIPKQSLIDYIVYMCSGLSFWLGLCPLNLINRGEKKLRRFLGQRTGKRTKGQRGRLIRQENTGHFSLGNRLSGGQTMNKRSRLRW